MRSSHFTYETYSALQKGKTTILEQVLNYFCQLLPFLDKDELITPKSDKVVKFQKVLLNKYFFFSFVSSTRSRFFLNFWCGTRLTFRSDETTTRHHNVCISDETPCIPGPEYYYYPVQITEVCLHEVSKINLRRVNL